MFKFKKGTFHNINFCKHFKKFFIFSASIILIGIIATVIFGVKLDINFKGGTRITYSYSGEINLDDAAKTIQDTINVPVNVTKSTSFTGDSTKLVITLVEDKSLSTESQTSITTALQEKYPDNNIEFAEINSVNASMGKSFFVKSLAAVALAGVLVILYIGIRFRNIGGFSAGVSAFIALIHDVLMAFLFCNILRIDIDSNFIAVVLTILGYSLNDTVVIYDRIRENKKFFSQLSTRELTNKSINETLGRTITTSFATFLAIFTVGVICEISGLTSLRSFVVPMIIGGVLSGSYSTICIAGPLWVLWSEYSEKRRAKKSIKKKSKNYA